MSQKRPPAGIAVKVSYGPTLLQKSAATDLAVVFRGAPRRGIGVKNLQADRRLSRHHYSPGADEVTE